MSGPPPIASPWGSVTVPSGIALTTSRGDASTALTASASATSDAPRTAADPYVDPATDHYRATGASFGPASPPGCRDHRQQAEAFRVAGDWSAGAIRVVIKP